MAREAIGQSAITQILSSGQKKQLSDKEKKDAIAKIEAACKRFDQSKTGRLTVDDFYNVIKVQQKFECSKDDIRRMVEDLDMDKKYTVSISVSSLLLLLT